MASNTRFTEVLVLGGVVAGLAALGMLMFWLLGGWGLAVLFVSVAAYGVYRARGA
jgi:hypothetical protein